MHFSQREMRQQMKDRSKPPGLLLGQQTGEELLLFDAMGLMSAHFSGSIPFIQERLFPPPNPSISG